MVRINELKHDVRRALGTAAVLFGTAFCAQAQDAPVLSAWSGLALMEHFTAPERDLDASATAAATDTSGRVGFKVDKVHTLPVYPGCERAGSSREEQFACLNQMIRTLIARNVRYPEVARQKVIEGRVWIAFVIDKEGYADEVWVERSVDPLLDAEALRVIKMLPRMKPATVDGRPVNLRYSIPINFQLK